MMTFFFLQIFTERPPNEPPTERLRPDTVIDYLHRFPKAVITYLEYLVFQKKLEVWVQSLSTTPCYNTELIISVFVVHFDNFVMVDVMFEKLQHQK